MTKTHKIKLTSATVVNGQAVAAGNIVDVDDAKARRLLDAGKAVLATEEDVEAAEEAGTDPTEPAAAVLPAETRAGKQKGASK